MPSEYQLALFRAIHSLEHVDLRVIFARDLPPERRAIGWDVSLDVPFNVQFLDRQQPIRDAVRIVWQQRNRLHIIGGMWAVKPFMAALMVVRVIASHYFVYSEAPNPNYKRSPLTPLLQQIVGTLIARSSRAGLLCVSHFSRDFYSEIGFDSKRIYDFGYFGRTNTVKGNDPDGLTSLIYVGQLIHRKRLDLLINAIAPQLSENFHLTLVGSGDEMENLQALVASYQVQDYVTFAGPQPFEKVVEYLTHASALVLPSDYDGWGMVVNEALMVGIPVIVSDGCGAADVIIHGRNGYIFEKGSLTSLKDVIAQFLAADQSALRQQAAITGEQLSVENASQYLIACIQHKIGQIEEKPLPLWQRMP